MSYILDALRKADAQRERSRSPGLHDQPLPARADDARGWAGAPLLWAALAFGAVSTGLAVWQLAPPAASSVAASAASPMPTDSPGAAAVSQVAPVPAPAAAIVPPPPRPMPAPVAAAPPPASPSRGVQGDGAARKPPPPVVSSQQAAAAPAAAQAVVSPSGPVATEPPTDAPKLAISGGVYSQDAGQRMLIVNGQVFNEGSEPVPGVRLEQIRPNQAVLSYRGQRYSVRY